MGGELRGLGIAWVVKKLKNEKKFVICRLKTYIGNNLLRLETKKRILETEKIDWKQNKYIGNNRSRLITLTDMF